MLEEFTCGQCIKWSIYVDWMKAVHSLPLPLIIHKTPHGHSFCPTGFILAVFVDYVDSLQIHAGSGINYIGSWTGHIPAPGILKGLWNIASWTGVLSLKFMSQWCRVIGLGEWATFQGSTKDIRQPSVGDNIKFRSIILRIM